MKISRKERKERNRADAQNGAQNFPLLVYVQQALQGPALIFFHFFCAGPLTVGPITVILF